MKVIYLFAALATALVASFAGLQESFARRQESQSVDPTAWAKDLSSYGALAARELLDVHKPGAISRIEVEGFMGSSRQPRYKAYYFNTANGYSCPVNVAVPKGLAPEALCAPLGVSPLAARSQLTPENSYLILDRLISVLDGPEMTARLDHDVKVYSQAFKDIIFDSLQTEAVEHTNDATVFRVAFKGTGRLERVYRLECYANVHFNNIEADAGRPAVDVQRFTCTRTGI